MRLELLASPFIFAWDYISCIRNDAHTCHRYTYYLLRLLYKQSKGASATILSLPYRALHPFNAKISTEFAEEANKLRVNGFIKLGETARSAMLAKALNAKLQNCPVLEVLPYGQTGSEYGSVNEGYASCHRRAARLLHHPKDVIDQTETWELISTLKLTEVAGSYLECTPLLTNISSWHVVDISRILDITDPEEHYSVTAQTYHYDMDWIKFVKAFVNLTPAKAGSGPFEYLRGTHKPNRHKHYTDRRIQEPYADRKEYFDKLELADGDTGSLFMADTSGLHRDGRSSGMQRHVLMVEYAISSFGAKYQLNQDYLTCSEIIRSRKIYRYFSNPRTLNLFNQAQEHRKFTE